ncbi:ClpX C4-type zinc finger protein [Actinopolymorpha pittospori]|uniref:ClpX C4-type zinc finger protein n=1 Tax=Actinopolymorpha pittospori TaxID=648752 RepID=UPI003080E4D3
MVWPACKRPPHDRRARSPAPPHLPAGTGRSPSPPSDPPDDHQPRCSFCLLPRGLVRGLVASDDTGAMICDECLEEAARLLRGHLRRRWWWRWW